MARFIITGGHQKVTLTNAGSLTSAVSQGFGSSGNNNPKLLGSQDFAVKNPVYLDNHQWLVLTVQPTKNNFDPSLMVFKKVNGAWQRVLGPGSEFSTTVKISLPKSVGSYLSKQGVLVD